MKRVRSGCIFQSLVFSQKPDSGLSKERILEMNKNEVERYKADLECKGTRYRITDEIIEDDGSIVLKVRKEYNSGTDVSEYFM